jgi:hypothetical protein
MVRRFLLPVMSVLLTMAGGWAAEHEPGELPSIRVGMYEQEVGAAFTVADGLPTNDVTSVVHLADGTLIVGTADGLITKSNGTWELDERYPEGPVWVAAAPPNVDTGYYEKQDDGRLHSTSSQGRGGVFVLAGGVVHAFDSREHFPLPMEVRSAGALNAIGVDRGLFLSTRAGFFLLTNETTPGGIAFRHIDGLNELLGPDKNVYDAAMNDRGHIAVAAASGLFYTEDLVTWQRLFPKDGDRSWAPVDVRAVTFDSRGRLWFACPQGVGVLGDGWKLYTGMDGLPYNDFTCLTAGEDGVVWLGTRLGAIRFDGDHWGYREGRRWLPHNEVRDIAVTPEGHAWFATPGGLGLIERRPMTLAQKARYFIEETETYNLRTPYSYVLSAHLARPGDRSEWTNHDSDNDGLYTGVYGAAMSLAYAVTGDSKMKERAKRSFEALAFLSEVTQGGSNPAPHGFVARTILPTSGPNPNDGRIEGDRRKQATDDAMWKVYEPRWPTSADGKWYWKSDTSSDELDGHFFLYGIYYDHVAETEAEKARVREVVARVADHIVEHDFQLIDHDGRPTRWARFGPHDLNDDWHWWFERGLNSLSVLAHLRVAEHVTGDPKYGEAIDELVTEHKYAMNALQRPKVQSGPGSFTQFDDIMAFMNYYHYLKYEQDSELWQMIARGFFDYWDVERYEMNPVFNWIYAASCYGKVAEEQWGPWDLTPKYDWLEDSVDTLKRYPLDLANWRMTNSHRIDVKPLPVHVREGGETAGTGYRVINNKVLPMDERYLSKWGDDVWRLDTGGNGQGLNDGAPYLLASYMGLYHGFIVEE